MREKQSITDRADCKVNGPPALIKSETESESESICSLNFVSSM